jgi:hypothetical protein
MIIAAAARHATRGNFFFIGYSGAVALHGPGIRSLARGKKIGKPPAPDYAFPATAS